MNGEHVSKRFFMGSCYLEVDNRELRATMMSSLMAGYVFTNEIVGIRELAKVSERSRKSLFAGIIQTILTKEIG